MFRSSTPQLLFGRTKAVTLNSLSKHTILHYAKEVSWNMPIMHSEEKKALRSSRGEREKELKHRKNASELEHKNYIKYKQKRL